MKSGGSLDVEWGSPVPWVLENASVDLHLSCGYSLLQALCMQMHRSLNHSESLLLCKGFILPSSPFLPLTICLSKSSNMASERKIAYSVSGPQHLLLLAKTCSLQTDCKLLLAVGTVTFSIWTPAPRAVLAWSNHLRLVQRVEWIKEHLFLLMDTVRVNTINFSTMASFSLNIIETDF